ncbi:Enhancer of polycomb-like protein 1 [Apophysomyces sp. BC1034]|nr:Enhancer of polycomb-like protein 1 [Apophysomyces sp. BC1015]KAG0182164.1 Enhancer of polycomb-like protein 1 [Apophysomyces sp. BC1021]KAG0192821.1 Enhancer of polycomb-like protein 1 [Apophysomyces sp. BC1034]
MTNQMVSRFRVKKLSPKHPLPVYKESQLPDLTDAANIQRAVPQIETGVEKEEEEEHDLQAAISAAQAAVTTGAKVERYIPTPNASNVIQEDSYYSLYKRKFKEPSTFIRFSSTVEDCTGCPYVLDSEDEEFLAQFNKNHETLTEDEFEKDPLQTPQYADFLGLLPESSNLHGQRDLENIYSHWRERRVKREGKTIIPSLKSEDALKNEIDPYVCFRRRETKPLRKTRRTDQQSLERLRKLRTEMEMARNLLEMVLRREKFRKEGLVLEHMVFDKKCKLRDFQRQLGIKEDDDLLPFSNKKKRKVSLESGSGATIKIPLNKLKRDGLDGRQDKSPMQIALEAELSRKRERDAPYEDTTECPYQPLLKSIPDQFFQCLSHSKPSYPRFRKRIGRGGRVYLDRVNPSKQHERITGKFKPLGFQNNRYKFDTDWSDDEENEVEVDVMQDSHLKHRTQLLTEVELRNLVTIPFLTPLNMMSLHAANMRANHAAAVQRASMTNGSTPNGAPVVNRPPVQNSSLPIKRQNSRTKMTPQQAAVAMANGMIAANMAAVVNGTAGQNKAVQMAMAAAQQQQQQQQQGLNGGMSSRTPISSSSTTSQSSSRGLFSPQS